MNTKREIIRFSIAGTFVGATDFSIYYFLIHFLSFSLSKAISFICAVVVAYLFNKHWIFQHNQPFSYPEVGRYCVVNVLALGINIAINQGVLNLWPGAVLFALIIASMTTGLLTFGGFKWWVFRTQLG